MYFYNIDLSNYRCFSHIKLALNQNMNVIIGESSSGKTAILDAMATLLCGLVSPYNIDKNKMLTNNDFFAVTKSKPGCVERVPHYPLSINCDIQLDCLRTFAIKRNNRTDGSIIASDRPTEEILDYIPSAAKNMYKLLPIAVYYKSDRNWRYNDINPFPGGFNDRMNGYNDCLVNAASAKRILDWFARKHYETHGEGKFSFILGNVITALITSFSMLEPGTKDINMFYDHDISQLVITYTNKYGVVHRCSLNELGDSTRNVLSLIADIAIRMATINPDIDNPFRVTRGIILIDNIEAYLSSYAQKEIIKILKTIFHQVQFIITTQSPLVVASMSDGDIIELRSPSEAHYYGKSLYGKDANSILSSIFNTHERPTDIAILFDEFYDLLNDGKYVAAEIKLHEISDQVGERDNGVLVAKMQLQNEAYPF